jgi:hypothetical protein
MATSDEELYASEEVASGGDKARDAIELARQMKRHGAFPPKIGDRVAHELEHALEDKGKKGRFRIVKRDGLIVPSYETQGYRNPKEKSRIARAPHDPSPTDIQIAEENEGARGVLKWIASWFKR